MLVTLDFETYYDRKYSLKHLSTRDYVMDPRFECIGVSLKLDARPAMFFPQPKVEKALAAVPWASVTALAWNSRFDGSVLEWRYGHRPGAWADAMAMAQATIYHETGSASLAACAKHAELPPKGDAVVQMIGRTFASMTPAELAHYGAYCAHDTELCHALFMRLRHNFPPNELELIHHNLVSYLRPLLRLDAHLVAEHLHQTRQRKQSILASTGLDSRETLMSNDMFSLALMDLGVEIPWKQSPSDPGKLIPAFAKTDNGLKELLDHDDERVQTLVAARLSVKSTQEETRAERLLDIANRYGSLAVPLKYSAAHTHRWGGDEKINLQNLGRGSPLRRAIQAPPGCLLVKADASQIECRINATLAGQNDLVEAFRAGEDVYASLAEDIFNYPVTKRDNPVERFTGKVAELSCGYQCGRDRFYGMLRAQAPEGVKVEKEIATVAHSTYRRNRDKIVANWGAMEGNIPVLASPGGRVEWKCLVFEHGIVRGPTGLNLYYKNLRQRTKENGHLEWVYQYGRFYKYLYGGKLVENYTQFLARCITLDTIRAMARSFPRARYVLQVHDELVFVVEGQQQSEEALECLTGLMAKPPAWLPELPLASEGSISERYG